MSARRVGVAALAPLAPLWRRSRWAWQRRMGWAGVVGLGLLAAALAATVLAGLHDDERRQLLRQHVARLDARVRVDRGGAPEQDPRDVARLAMPASAQRGANLAELLKLLSHAKVEVSGAQYRIEDVEPGLRRLRVTVPVKGGYAGVRRLVGDLLNQMPNAALDGLDLEREGDGGLVSGRLRLSLFFRKELE